MKKRNSEIKNSSSIALVGPLDQAAAVTYHIHQYPDLNEVTTVALGALSAEQLEVIFSTAEDSPYAAIVLLESLAGEVSLQHVLNNLHIAFTVADKTGIQPELIEQLFN